MAWTRISAGKPSVRGIHPRYTGLMEVYVPLSPEPPEEWARFFENPSGVSISLSMHPPHIQGNQVYIRPPDKEIEQYLTHVLERINAANDWYEQQVLPRIQARERAEQERKDSEAHRVNEARKRLEGGK